MSSAAGRAISAYPAAAPPDLSEFLKLRLDYLKIFDAVIAEHRLDALVFPQMSKAPPGIFDKATYPATTVSEINIAGLPSVTVPAGGRFSNGSPFSPIFVGPMWSEAELLGFAFAYEQATRHRIVPQPETTAHAPAGDVAIRDDADDLLGHGRNGKSSAGRHALSIGISKRSYIWRGPQIAV